MTSVYLCLNFVNMKIQFYQMHGFQISPGRS